MGDEQKDDWSLSYAKVKKVKSLPVHAHGWLLWLVLLRYSSSVNWHCLVLLTCTAVVRLRSVKPDLLVGGQHLNCLHNKANHLAICSGLLSTTAVAYFERTLVNENRISWVRTPIAKRLTSKPEWNKQSWNSIDRLEKLCIRWVDLCIIEDCMDCTIKSWIVQLDPQNQRKLSCLFQ